MAPSPSLENPRRRCTYINYQYQPVGCRIRLAGRSLPAKDAGTGGGGGEQWDNVPPKLGDWGYDNPLQLKRKVLPNIFASLLKM